MPPSIHIDYGTQACLLRHFPTDVFQTVALFKKPSNCVARLHGERGEGCMRCENVSSDALTCRTHDREGGRKTRLPSPPVHNAREKRGKGTRRGVGWWLDRSPVSGFFLSQEKPSVKNVSSQTLCFIPPSDRTRTNHSYAAASTSSRSGDIFILLCMYAL